MIKNPVFSVLCTLFIMPLANGMEKKPLEQALKEKTPKQEKIKIEKRGDADKLIAFRDQHRGRHDVFAQEHNQGKSGDSDKK